MATKRQAAFNGELGANGKPYKKGQFIAEQEDYQGRATKPNRGTGKQEIEPYVWQLPDDPHMRSIFKFIQGVFGDLKTGTINEQSVAFHGENILKIRSLIARYQAGERWYYPDHEEYI